MYVCIYVCVYIYICVYIYTYTYIYNQIFCKYINQEFNGEYLHFIFSKIFKYEYMSKKINIWSYCYINVNAILYC